MPEHNEDKLLTDLADEAGLGDALVKRLPGQSRYPEWILDAIVDCPSCGVAGDGAAIFGTAPITDYIAYDHPSATATHLHDGLTGTCDSCGSAITVRLTVT